MGPMTKVRGQSLVVRALLQEGVKAGFFIEAGPFNGLAKELDKSGVQLIDVRHEQAAAMAAHAYTRVSGRPAICFGGSGPGTVNMTTGVAVAYADRAPLIVLSGSANYDRWHTDAFQEMDQVMALKPFTKWCQRVVHANRIPEMVSMAFRHAFTGCPAPVCLDLPQDVLSGEVEEDEVQWPANYRPRSRPQGDPAAIGEAVKLLSKAQRPLVLSGSGILWSEAHQSLQEFVHAAGIPFYTTPLGRGVIPEDDALCFLGARSSAWRHADVVLVIGTRPNYLIGELKPPRWAPDLKVIMANIEPTHVGLNRGVDVDILGDARMVLQQLTLEAKGRIKPAAYETWVRQLREQDAIRREQQATLENSDKVPIHPLRLCRDLREVLPRDAILAVDGHETLNFARQSIPSYLPRHRLNSGHAGCMGVGVPFGLGAKVARPDKTVAVLHGDGSFGMNCMELDTAVRRKIPFLTVILNNGGWTAKGGFDVGPGQDLGFTRYDLMFAPLGVHPEYVTEPKAIRPSLERALAAVERGQPALVNVICDDRAHSSTVEFSTMYGSGVVRKI